MILLAEHDEPTLAAKKKRPHGASSWPTSTPKNRVWSFENTPSGRPVVEPQLTQETAIGSVQYTYQIASGRAEWLSRDPLGERVGPNLYSFVANDPIDSIDSLGLCPSQECIDAMKDLNDAINSAVKQFQNYNPTTDAQGGVPILRGGKPIGRNTVPYGHAELTDALAYWYERKSHKGVEKDGK